MRYSQLWHERGEFGMWLIVYVAVYLLADSGLKVVEMTEEEKKNPFYPKVRPFGKDKWK